MTSMSSENIESLESLASQLQETWLFAQLLSSATVHIHRQFERAEVAERDRQLLNDLLRDAQSAQRTCEALMSNDDIQVMRERWAKILPDARAAREAH